MRSPQIFFAIALMMASLAIWTSVVPAQPAPSPTSQPADLPTAHVDHAGLLKLSWQLVVEPTATGDSTVFDAIDRLHAMVVHHIDLVEGQPISPENKDVIVDLNLSSDQAAALLAKVKSVHMDFVTLSVTDEMSTEAQCRKAMDLAKKLKVKRIVCQPTGDALPLLDRLTAEFHVGISIVNRADAGPYKDPAAILAALQGHSPLVGACADIAEFRRAGIVPLEAVQKLSGHLLDVRLSDVDAQGAVVGIGSGTVDAAAILKEIKGQKFKGAVTLGPANSVRSIAPFIESLNVFSDMVEKLAGG
jgi:sugar phosphate isomerase/epimerase